MQSTCLKSAAAWVSVPLYQIESEHHNFSDFYYNGTVIEKGVALSEVKWCSVNTAFFP